MDTDALFNKKSMYINTDYTTYDPLHNPGQALSRSLSPDF